MTKRASRNGLAILRVQKWVEALFWRSFVIDNDVAAKHALFEMYQGYAQKIARKEFYGRSRHDVQLSEVEQMAYEGLLQAIERYDPTFPYPFRAYARRRISGHIADGIAGSSELNRQFTTRRKVEQERLRSVSDNGPDDPETALEALTKLVSGLALGLMLEGTGIYSADDAQDRQPNGYDNLVWKQAIHQLSKEVGKLPEKQAIILKQHYEYGVSFTQIAKLLSLSKGRVSQLHGEALRALRKRLGKF